MFISAGAFAQNGTTGGYMTGGYSVYDSTVIPTKRMGQQNEFWNNTHAFPAKPRNMYEFGVSTGVFNVGGDVTTKVFTAPNVAVHIRKALGYLVSLRLQYLYATGEGLNYKPSANFAKNTPWTNAGYFAPTRSAAGPIVYSNAAGNTSNTGNIVYYNYRSNVQDISLQGLVSLSNILFHKAKPTVDLYTGGGAGVTFFHTKVNALNEGGSGGTTNYAALFTKVNNDFNGKDLYKNRKDIRKALKAGMDNTYESEAQNDNDGKKIKGYTLKPSLTALIGVAFKLSNRFNVALEDRFTTTRSDLIDGQRWAEQATGDAVLTPQNDSYNYASVGLNANLGSMKKAVQPLYWLNPLDYAYSELNTPKHMKLPKPSLEDSDGDGVLDQLDREPNTPAGCPVDTHGVTKDTDGDGVPDCKDKQLITPTECQPVNADGVGKCPDPECCKNMSSGVKNDVPVGCPSDYPSLSFKGNMMNNDNKAMLSAVASKMKANPNCNISITGYPEASKAAQAVCNSRNESIKKYLVESQGISADRISINCEVGNGTNKNTVDIKSN